MRFQEPTKWELFLDGFHNFWNCLDCYNDGDTWGYDEFFEGLNLGYYQQYIWDYDDPYNPTISKERQLRLGEKPPVIYVSKQDFDFLVEKLNEPPKYNENLAKLLNRKSPWNE
jgi:hypothetical protein